MCLSRLRLRQDNYSEKITRVTGNDGRTKYINNDQATQYVPTIEAFEDRQWEGILVAVWEILSEGNRRKHSKPSLSRASSAFDMEEGRGWSLGELRSDIR
jgi:hypothetical protein